MVLLVAVCTPTWMFVAAISTPMPYISSIAFQISYLCPTNCASRTSISSLSTHLYLLIFLLNYLSIPIDIVIQLLALASCDATTTGINLKFPAISFGVREKHVKLKQKLYVIGDNICDNINLLHIRWCNRFTYHVQHSHVWRDITMSHIMFS